jgi:hypothetical protein
VIGSGSVIPAAGADIFINNTTALMAPHQLSPLGTPVYHSEIISQKSLNVNN